ncbi:flagellar hook-basal body complex protein FliE [Sulfitobacter mediterraneus]|uniref:flagellar hook-basal body complex protein FliE n=1 Tax=Sulfitobacter mediterraneus TaxID=83219 RepID=UPI001931D06B|nr:flagellar hook-basal body complex protein FliE [Sulfitobacter mediterraneus]MBM1308775.1 flagellar hook-basal body complex protein FliE [Sulfitobacter mediterraneus]MBM1312660.1 flagellar hook-basal body complex protein FliE [Sulfitobacter mediterraneus]MBM1321042.1 flagellar hook-basal body complex protein FliE [Sulfitobacter mediterraneus]MBM1324929.1 flagellar hook-basal body complex protein FliE [Sulfitobacter mediterraneus]MBM1396276.1 flagellar hook-basal body complex protein FliE [Su
MDIKGLSAIQKYQAARPATEPANPAEAAKTIINDFATTLAVGEQTAKDAMIGDADPHALVTALAQTELAVETAVTVRNKVVEAYQEILRMPV